jgi:hypothetical protein
MGGQGFVPILEKKNPIKLGFKVCGIWPLNLQLWLENFGPNKVFTTTEEEGEKKCILIKCNKGLQ